MTSIRLLLVTDAVGGVWTYSLELARALKPLGVETVLAVAGPSPSMEQYEEASDFDVIDTGLPLEWIESDSGVIGRAGETVARFARTCRADIVQTSSAAMLARAHFDQPTVAVQHSCVATWWAAVKGGPLPHQFEWRRDLVKAGLQAASAVVAPTRAFANATSALYDVHVAAVHNGRSPSFSRDLPQGNFAFTAGRLWDEGKNIRTLDAAASSLSILVHAAGPAEGPNGARASLHHLVPAGELSAVRVAGLLSAKPVYASAALYEPFGLSVLEAALAGCVLVLSDIPTHRELWGGAACFVPARDDRAFAATIEALIQNPERREQMGQRAARRAQHYSPGRMAGAMLDIYVRLLNDAAGPVRLAGAA